MKQEIQAVNNLSIYLNKIIQPIVKSPSLIRSGRPLKNIKLLPREVLGLFLICAVGSFIDPDNIWTIASDSEGRDGVVYCKKGVREGDAFATEQAYIFKENTGWLSTLVIKRVIDKSSLGPNYGKDRHLVIYIDKKGKLNWDRIMNRINSYNSFLSIWLIAKNKKTKWSYIVMTIKNERDDLIAYEVKIEDNFFKWDVTKLGRL